MESSGYADVLGIPPDLGGLGENVASLLDYLLRRDRNRFLQVVQALRHYVPGLEEIEVATPDASRRRVELVIERGLRIPASHASTGLRFMLFFVALAHHTALPELVLIEEPENGIHPQRLEEVVRLFRDITKGVHGASAQIILTTHSPYLLDVVDLEIDQVLIFRREEDSARTVVPADAAKLKAFLGEFKLGEIWFNQGEESLGAR